MELKDKGLSLDEMKEVLRKTYADQDCGPSQEEDNQDDSAKDN